MAKKPKRRPAASTPADARRAAMQQNKRELARYQRDVRAVNQLTRKLKRDVENADDALRNLAAWLSAREFDRETLDEHADKRQPEPANT